MKQLSTSRRHMLAGVGMLFVSGCYDFDRSDSGGETGVSLGSLFLSDSEGRSQSVQLELQRMDETVFEDTVEPTEGGEVIDPTWSTDPAEYTLLWETEEFQGNVSIPMDFDQVVDPEECHHAMFNFRTEQLRPVVQLYSSEDIESGTGTC